jgi:hypothetical protein
MSQVLNEINHNIKNKTRQSPQRSSKKKLNQNFNAHSNMKILYAQRNILQQSSNLSLLGLDQQSQGHYNYRLNSGPFSQSPVRNDAVNVQLPSLNDARLSNNNVLSPLPERSHEALTSTTVRQDDSQATAYMYGGNPNTSIAREDDPDIN